MQAMSKKTDQGFHSWVKVLFGVIPSDRLLSVFAKAGIWAAVAQNMEMPRQQREQLICRAPDTYAGKISYAARL